MDVEILAEAAQINLFRVIFRWLHVGPVIVTIGGAFFMRYVMIPSVGETLSEEQRETLRAAITGRWRKVVYTCIGLILISGLFNIYYAIVVLGKPILYHILFAPKLLAALGIFFIASALVGRSEALENMRRDAKKWLGVLIGLAVVIVIISGIMKNLPNKPRTQNDQTASQWYEEEPGLA